MLPFHFGPGEASGGAWTSVVDLEKDRPTPDAQVGVTEGAPSPTGANDFILGVWSSRGVGFVPWDSYENTFSNVRVNRILRFTSTKRVPLRDSPQQRVDLCTFYSEGLCKDKVGHCQNVSSISS